MVPAGHHQCALASVAILHRAFPDENFAYFYLGNWFTDVSQFIAPVDYAAAERTIVDQGMTMARAEGRRQAEAAHHTVWYAPNFAIDNVRRVGGRERRLRVGQPLHPRHVRQSAPARLGAGEVLPQPGLRRRLGPLLPRGQGQQDGRRGGDPFAEYDRLFQRRFTQYYPHEHMDRWPANETRPSSLGRHLYDYLERDIGYVAELLSFVERGWAQAARSADEAGRHDALVEMGHAIHAVEDYFAHSNFIEFAARALGAHAHGR